MTKNVTITGQNEILAALNKFSVDAEGLINKSVKETTFSVRNIAVKSIQTEDSGGKSYKRGKDKYHKASPAGKPPNTDTGRLAGDISVKYEGGSEGWVYTMLDYGMHLEFGTTKIDPRPWLQPAADQSSALFEISLKRGLGMLLNE